MDVVLVRGGSNVHTPLRDIFSQTSTTLRFSLTKHIGKIVKRKRSKQQVFNSSATNSLMADTYIQE